jgi:hypothetical protein
MKRSNISILVSALTVSATLFGGTAQAGQSNGGGHYPPKNQGNDQTINLGQHQGQGQGQGQHQEAYGGQGGHGGHGGNGYGGQGGSGVGLGVGIGKGGDANASNNNHVGNSNQVSNGNTIKNNNDSNASAHSGSNSSSDNNSVTNSNSSSGSSASANGSSGNNFNYTEGDSDYDSRGYYQGSMNINPNGGYSFGVTNKYGTVQGGCPTKSAQFSAGAWLGGISFGGNSDKLPKDCAPLVELNKRAYLDGVLGESVGGLSHFDKLQAFCTQKAYALKENYGVSSSVAECIKAATKVKTPSVPPVMIKPLPPVYVPSLPPVVPPTGQKNG